MLPRIQSFHICMAILMVVACAYIVTSCRNRDIIDDAAQPSAHHTLYPNLTFRCKNALGFKEYCINKDPTVIMVEIPAATFTMGWHNDYSRREEEPPTRVTIDAFLISKHEITVAQFQRFSRSEDVRDAERGSLHLGDNLDIPVVVSWAAAKSYAEWIGGSLPTSAEWEYAASGQDERLFFPWGDEYPTKNAGLANLRYRRDHSAEDKSRGNHSGALTPIGSYPKGAGPFGLLDQTGNASEWTDDWMMLNYPGGAIVNLRGPSSGVFRIVRGGSYDDVPREGFVKCVNGSLPDEDRNGLRPVIRVR